MLNKLLDTYARLFARPSLFKLNRAVMLAGLRGLGVQNYGTAWLSGETLLLRRLLTTLDEPGGTVVDVGANVGDFTAQVVAETRHLRVVAFEPHPLTVERLRRRFAATAGRVDIRNAAVGSEAGTISLYDYADEAGSEHASVIASVITGTHGREAEERIVEMVSLDGAAIPGTVRLLKVDVEGFEHAVLLGARELIDRQRPDHVILEFNEMNVRSKTFFSDIAAALDGYRAYRILPGGKLLPLDSPYQALTHEVFGYQNLCFSRATLA